MVQAAKIIATGLITTDLIVVGLVINILFKAFILNVAINSSLISKLFAYAIKSLAFAEGKGFFVIIMVFLYSISLFLLSNLNNKIYIYISNPILYDRFFFTY